MTTKKSLRQRFGQFIGGTKLQPAEKVEEIRAEVASNMRGELEIQMRKFAAAQINRNTAGWLANDQSINTELRGDLSLLRSRGRDLVKNNDFAKKFREMCKINIIGPDGIRLQSRVEDKPDHLDDLANSAIERAWQDWCLSADITGRQSFNDICRTLVSGLPADGEFLAVMVRGADAGNAYNFAIQIIDVDRIDTSFDGTYMGNTVIMGVEVNSYRRPVALHIFQAHPNDGLRTRRVRQRIPIENVLHCFKVEVAEQMRGIPWMAAGMVSLHHLGNFGLSALLAAEHGANNYGFFEKDETAVMTAPIGQETDEAGTYETTSVQGYFDILPQGYKFSEFKSQYPNTVFGPFVKTTLQRIASGWGVSYHSLANDLESVNFSSIRSGTIEERDRWKIDQEWFVNCFCRPVFLAWLQMALLSNKVVLPNGSVLPAGKYDKFKRHEWQPRAWEWVDPKNDIEANIAAVNAGFKPPQDIAAANGYDFDSNLRQLAKMKKLMAELGINLPAYDSAPGANSNEKPPSATEKPPPKK